MKEPPLAQLRHELPLVRDDAQVDAMGALKSGEADEYLNLVRACLAPLLGQEMQGRMRVGRHVSFSYLE